MATVVRDYNEEREDGWYHVFQMSDGTYRREKIPPSGYAAANIPGGGGGGQTYQTRNGPKTLAQITSEMQGANYGGPWDPVSLVTAYQNVGTSGGGMYGAGSGFDYAGGWGMLDPALQAQAQLINARNYDLQRLISLGYSPYILNADTDYYSLLKDIPTGDRTVWLTQASRATGLPAEVLAYAYQMGGFAQGMPDQAAFGRILDTAANQGQQSFANQQWQELVRQQQAGLTGMYQGAPTFQRQQWEELTEQQRAALTGMYGGNPTLAKQQWEQSVRQDEAAITGMYGGAPTFGRQQWETGQTGYLNGTPTMAREELQNKYGMQLLNLASSLRGPENYYQYANAMRGAAGSQPEAWAQNLLGGGATPGFQAWDQSKPASLQGLLTGYGPSAQGADDMNRWGSQQPIDTFYGQPRNFPTAPVNSQWDQFKQRQMRGGGGSQLGGAPGQYGNPHDWWGPTPPSAGPNFRPGKGYEAILPGPRYPGEPIYPAGNLPTVPIGGETNPNRIPTAGNWGTPETNPNWEFMQTPTLQPNWQRGQLQPGVTGMTETPARMTRGYNVTPAQMTWQGGKTPGSYTGGPGPIWPSGRAYIGGVAGTPLMPQAHQLNARSVYNMNPTETSMMNSALGAAGYQPEDYWNTFRRSAPRGTAATGLRWG